MVKVLPAKLTALTFLKQYYERIKLPLDYKSNFILQELHATYER